MNEEAAAIPGVGFPLQEVAAGAEIAALGLALEAADGVGDVVVEV